MASFARLKSFEREPYCPFVNFSTFLCRLCAYTFGRDLGISFSFRDGGPDEKSHFTSSHLQAGHVLGNTSILYSTERLFDRFTGGCLHLADVALDRAWHSMTE